jgi:hypothetical protein
MNQPVAQVTIADLERLVRRDFPADQVAAVHAVLAAYGTEPWHGEAGRVRAALLRLADGNVDRLRAALLVAQSDYRDVLAAAEYPAYLKDVSPTDSTPVQRNLAINTDAATYRQWLERR